MKQKITIILAIAIALVGSYKYIGGYVTVSSNVNGRELPIYCVQTEEKKVALSFDAAWGDAKLGFLNGFLKTIVSLQY